MISFDTVCVNAGWGKSEKMNHLFRLWSFKLRELFDATVYLDFFRIAQEDGTLGHCYGLECLFRYFSYGLEKDFRENVYSDFERLVLVQYHQGGIYGLEKFWAFHSFTGFPSGSKARMNVEVSTVCFAGCIHTRTS